MTFAPRNRDWQALTAAQVAIAPYAPAGQT
jgi:hypothetical protein